jgi:hypothetical protein
LHIFPHFYHWVILWFFLCFMVYWKGFWWWHHRTYKVQILTLALLTIANCFYSHIICQKKGIVVCFFCGIYAWITRNSFNYNNNINDVCKVPYLNLSLLWCSFPFVSLACLLPHCHHLSITSQYSFMCREISTF